MPSSNTQRVKPPALRPGDVIGIIGPASHFGKSDLEAGCAALERAGYRPFYFDSILDRELYFAGSVERRTREFQEMFAREDVRAIVCARGGYGANYLLPTLNVAQVTSHPKIFVGYSDLTALMTYFLTAANLITFHGPMVAKDWNRENGVDFFSWQSALSNSVPWDVPLGAEVGGLVDGEAEGILYGGCLSIVVASLGTPYQVKTAGTILFLEDVGEKPYQIDRMLMQLKLGGHLQNIRGIVFGEMLDCAQGPSQNYTLQEVIVRIVGDLGIPIAFGLRSGHVSSGNITLPLGVQARLTVSGGKVALKILESAVET
jgi:muramoyltetrapeptide carboxypeptidase